MGVRLKPLREQVCKQAVVIKATTSARDLHGASDACSKLATTSEPARVLFQAAPSGHEDYLEELAALLREAKGKPHPAAVAELRRRYDIEQLTALRNPPQHAHAG